ncbi:MAG: helix-turn-helix domain-containing protein, partial [Desulfurococcus sp.]
MLRPKEVCERLGISYTTLREYVKKGLISLSLLFWFSCVFMLVGINL